MVLQRIQPMFPESARMRIVCMQVNKIASDRNGGGKRRRQRQDAAQGMFLHQEITRSEREFILGDNAGVFEDWLLT